MNKYLRNSIVTTNMNVIFIVILNAITFEKDLSRNSWTMFVSSIKNNIVYAMIILSQLSNEDINLSFLST